MMDGLDVGAIDVFLFDCDGVLFRGSAVIAGVPETLDLLQRKHNKRVYFVTNNATKSREDNASKLRAFGIPATMEQVICSSFAAAALLQSLGKKRIFVVGESGIRDELALAQLEACTEQCDAVVAGLDRSFSYDKMAQALRQLQQGAIFVATNRDATFPADDGHFLPGAGSIIAALECCSGKTPLVAGKPSPWFVDFVKNIVGPHRCLMVGDRLDTDVAFGLSAGFQTLLVTETGVHSVEHIEQADVAARPHFHTSRVSNLAAWL